MVLLSKYSHIISKQTSISCKAKNISIKKNGQELTKTTCLKGHLNIVEYLTEKQKQQEQKQEEQQELTSASEGIENQLLLDSTENLGNVLENKELKQAATGEKTDIFPSLNN